MLLFPNLYLSIFYLICYDYGDLFITPVRTIEKSMRLAIEGYAIYPLRRHIWQQSAEIGIVIDKFDQFRRYSVTITL